MYWIIPDRSKVRARGRCKIWLAWPGPLAFVFSILIALFAPPAGAQDAATQPSPGSELLTNRAALPGYGVESYRILSGRDEIISVLRNGATVICKRVESPVAAVRGYAETGGVYEGKWLGGGLSHLLEHLVAGGSSERRTEAQNKALLQKIGNDSNAYTTYDHTAFFVNTTTANFADAVDLVTGWMTGALITPDEYRREYEVVQRELERNKGNPDMVFWQLIQDNRYKVSPARVPVIGYQEVIQGLSRNDVYSYYKLAYVPNNMVFSVAANLDPEVMLRTLQKNLQEFKPGRAFEHNIAQEPPVLAPRTVVATFPRLGQARLDLSFPSVKETDPDMYALDLLAQVLGGGEGSVLTEEIRDRQQLCSAISAYDETPSYVTGSFGVDVTLDASQIAQATHAILDQLNRVKTDGVEEDRLARAKAQMKIARLKQLQTSQSVAASLATDYLDTGDPHFSDLYVQRIQAVTPAQVQDVARRYLNSSRLLTTALVPREGPAAQALPKAEDLLRQEEASTSPSPETAPQTASRTTRTVLDNGLIVLHRRISTTPLIDIRMYALGGLTAEDAKTNGLGNLAMLMLRRGTTTRSAEQIADYFDLTGGDLTTTCGKNTWYWNVSCTRDDFPKTMEVYADVVNNPAFNPHELNEMRARVDAAIESQDAPWDEQAIHYFDRQYFGPLGSPYQFQPIGTRANVARFTPDDLRHWYQTRVLAAPRVLAIYGDIDNDAALDLARKYFGGGPRLPEPAPITASASSASASDAATQPSASDPAAVDVKRVEIQKTEQEVAGIFIGFDAHPYLGAPDQPALTVAQCLTGGYSYPTGYIFETLRGLGLVYEGGSFDSPGRSAQYPGAFIAYAGCDPHKVTQVVQIILQNMARLQGSAHDIQPDWFGRSKNLIDTEHALEIETPADQATTAATDELFGLGYDYDERFADRIDAVQLPQVQDLARSRLRDCVVTICTPDPSSVQIHPGIIAYSSFPPVDLAPRGVQHNIVVK